MIRSVSVCQCLRGRFSPGAGYLGHCPGYPPPPRKANFSNLDIVQGRVSQILSGIPPHLANFSSSDIVRASYSQKPVIRSVSVCQCLRGRLFSPGAGYLGHCLGSPPQSRFFQLGHCPGQGISDIVWDTPPPLGKFFQLGHCPGQL